jgi:hypothetical protein
LGVAILYNAPRFFESFWKVWLVQLIIIFFIYLINQKHRNYVYLCTPSVP